MLKKLLLAIASLYMSVGLAFADVEVNKADQAQLDSVKGIGPKISKSIVDERNKNGNFKDWNDFEKRVKGIGDKNSTKLSEAGLTVNGQSKPGATAKDSSNTSSTASADRSRNNGAAKQKSSGSSKSSTSDASSGGAVK